MSSTEWLISAAAGLVGHAVTVRFRDGADDLAGTLTGFAGQGSSDAYHLTARRALVVTETGGKVWTVGPESVAALASS
jgi:hypothetical protein